MNKRKLKLLSDKDLRMKYLLDQLRIGLRYQLRSIRESQDVTQKQLADMIGTKQSVISRLEAHPERLSLPTLLEIANAFDVGIVVRFEEIDSIIEWNSNPTVNKMTPRKSSEIINQILAETNESYAPGYVAYESSEIDLNVFISDILAANSRKAYEAMEVPYQQKMSECFQTPAIHLKGVY